jgi:hypothetical protein
LGARVSPGVIGGRSSTNKKPPVFTEGFPRNDEEKNYFFFFATFLAGAFFLAFLTAMI